MEGVSAMRAHREGRATQTNRTKAAGRVDIEPSSGNVFADLGLPHPGERLAKAELAHKIITASERRGLTQAEAAELLEVDQPKISALKRGRLAGFSLDRLVRFLVLLGNDVASVHHEAIESRGRNRRRSATSTPRSSATHSHISPRPASAFTRRRQLAGTHAWSHNGGILEVTWRP